MGRLLRALALAGTVAVLGGCGRWPGDWYLRVACLGDSNTFLALEEKASPSWCEYLADLGADRRWTTLNFSWFAVTAVDTERSAGQVSLSASDWVRKAVDARPGVAVLSYGTNDVRRGVPTGEIVAAVLRHRATLEQAGIEVYVTTVPLLYAPAEAELAPAIVAFDDALRAAVPASHVIDFGRHEGESDMQADGTRVPVRDGIHINAAAQRRRAQLVFEALRR